MCHTFKKSLVLWVIFIKKLNSLSLKKKVQFLNSYFKKVWILCVIFKKLNAYILRVIFKKFNGSIHKKIQFCGSDSKKFNSVSYFSWWKNFESWKKKGSISLNQKSSKKFKHLSDVKKKVQLFESCEKRSKYWSHEKRKEQFFESDWAKKKVQLLESCSKKDQFFVLFFKKVNSLGHIKKGFISSKHIEKYNPLSHIEHFYWKTCSILRVIFWKKVKFFKYYFEKRSILWVILKRRVQFCES